jgi:hypothetical protein
MPAPIPLLRTASGIKLATIDTKESHFLDLQSRLAASFLLDFPIKCYDKFLPSVQDKIKDPEYTCKFCESYFVTKVALKLHRKMHLRKHTPENDQEEEEEEETVEVVEEDGIYFIQDFGEWLSPVFEDHVSGSVP